ncbi:YeiH family protein [Campylobacter sp. MG1]|uniref:YeiH family protein n=1 Tax=Campylobacter sp. MG1 TaxID=2976332 RepID=UPI00226CC718|nr:putative sulfate exporter family transporter [Campylobacter sp. MG1]
MSKKHNKSPEQVALGVNKIYKSKKIESYVVLVVLAFCSYAIGELSFFKNFGISALIIAVILGAVIGNFAHHNVSLLKKTGALGVCTKQILRLGIILYGFRISLSDIESIGLSGVGLAFFIVFSTFFIGLLIGKLLKIDFLQSALIASGSSICGAAAVLASESVLKGGSARVGIAVCTVVVYGCIGMFVYPLVQNLFDLDGRLFGFLVGGTLHEVAHVVGAGSSIGVDGANSSIVIKMVRVLMLVPFLLMLSFGFKKEEKKGNFLNQIPWFALGFLLACGISSLPILNTEYALNVIKPNIAIFDTFLLSLAMVALGVNIRKDMLSKAGLKPFIMAAILCVWLVLAAYAYIKVFC